MSNKPFNNLWEADHAIRAACPIGMESGTKLTIRFVCGFELFNTRPYHNYETWSGGYEVSGPIGPVGSDWPEAPIATARAEDFDDAITAWIAVREKMRKELGPLDEQGAKE